MKKLILFSTLFVNICLAQTSPKVNLYYSVSQNECEDSYFHLTEDIKEGWSVYESSDGQLRIEGDTYELIQFLYNKCKLQSEMEITYLETIVNSVDWSNTVPDHFKKGKKWNEYSESLKSQGYVITNKK